MINIIDIITLVILLNKCVKTSQSIKIIEAGNYASPVILVHGGAGTISFDSYEDKVQYTRILF